MSTRAIAFWSLFVTTLAKFNEPSQLNLSQVIKLINREEKNTLVVYGLNEAAAGNVLKGLKSAVVVNLAKDVEIARSLWKFSFYLIICNHINEFDDFLQKFHRTGGWNSRARFLVINFQEQEIDKYFQLACRNFMVNFALINNRSYDVFTYVPFANNSCGCSSPIQKVFNRTSLTTIFSYKKLKHFNGCVLKVLPLIIPPYVINTTSSRSPGFDVMILREIALRLNFQVAYVENPHKHWGYLMPDGRFTDMYSIITSGQADLMIGMSVSNWTLVNAVDSIDGYVQEYVTFFVPAALPVDPWKNLALVFSQTTWILILTSLIFMSATFWLVDDSRTNTINNKSSLVNWFFISFSILLASCNQKPKLWLLRATLALWSIYCIWITSAYQGTLMSFLTKPAYQRQISTLEEMVASRLSYGGYPTLRSLFLQKDNLLFNKIYADWKMCPLTVECVNRTAQERDFGVVKNPRQIRFLSPKYYTLPNGKNMLYQLEEPVNRFLVAFTFTKGFPLFERFEEIMMRLRENGLIDKWDKEQKGADDRTVGNEGQVVVLTLEHLKVAFVVLIFGHSVALVVFLFEAKVRHTNIM